VNSVDSGCLRYLCHIVAGSTEEIEDLKEAYIETGGSIEGIISHIPHSNYSDESRFVKIINGLIAKGELEPSATWKKGLKDTKGQAARKKEGEKEEAEAENMARELGVWDEFYGNGKEGKRRGKGKGKKDEGGGDDGEEALKALIQGKQKKLGGFLDNLAAKYGAEDEGSKPKGKKRGRAAAAPEIDEEEFARIQAGLKKSKMEASGSSSSRSKAKKSR